MVCTKDKTQRYNIQEKFKKSSAVKNLQFIHSKKKTKKYFS